MSIVGISQGAGMVGWAKITLYDGYSLSDAGAIFVGPHEGAQPAADTKRYREISKHIYYSVFEREGLPHTAILLPEPGDRVSAHTRRVLGILDALSVTNGDGITPITMADIYRRASSPVDAWVADVVDGATNALATSRGRRRRLIALAIAAATTVAMDRQDAMS